MIFRKDEWARTRLDGRGAMTVCDKVCLDVGMVVCDKVCLDVVSTSSLLSSDESVFLANETPREDIYDN